MRSRTIRLAGGYKAHALPTSVEKADALLGEELNPADLYSAESRDDKS
jgi:hypothetical protein